MSRELTGTITLPVLDQITAQDNSRVSYEGFTGSQRLQALDNARIIGEKLSLSQLDIAQGDNARIVLDGKADTLIAQLEDNASLSAEELDAGAVTIGTRDNARVEVDATKSLQVTSLDNSYVWYARALPGMNLVRKGNARIWTDEEIQALETLESPSDY